MLATSTLIAHRSAAAPPLTDAARRRILRQARFRGGRAPRATLAGGPELAAQRLLLSGRFPRRLRASTKRRSAARRTPTSTSLWPTPPRLGCSLLKANFPRAWLDVNREPYELDPKMFAGSLPTYANVRSVRVAGGLGTIARIVSESEEIYAGPLNVQEALARIDAVYKPYHRALRQMVLDTRAAFGVAVLLDCHSMPSTVRGMHGRLRPDIVLGDRYGTSCASELTDLAAGVLSGLGYSVSRNKPYAGGFITEHYGQPARGLHAVQIEFNRHLYMDERTLAKTPRFERLAADLARLIGAFGEAYDDGFLSRRDAAE